MKLEVRSRFERICRYAFFQSVGEPLVGDVRSVGSWPRASKECSSRKWENCCLMARNALFRGVQTKSWDRAQEWGPLSDELRPLIISSVDTLLPEAGIPERYRDKVKNQLSWDIMLICFEHEYGDLVKPFFNVPLLDPWYARGHFPCGWDGEEFPDAWDGVFRSGRLLVF
jgi:hypothetical protein